MRWIVGCSRWGMVGLLWACLGWGVSWADSRIGVEGLVTTNSIRFNQIGNAADYLRVYQRESYNGGTKFGETVHLPSRVVMGPLLPQESIPSSGWSVMLTAPMVVKGGTYGIWGDFDTNFSQVRGLVGQNDATVVSSNMNKRSHVYQGVLKVTDSGSYPMGYSGSTNLYPIRIHLEGSILAQSSVFQLVVVIDPSSSTAQSGTPAIRIPISFKIYRYGNVGGVDITNQFQFMWPGQLSMPDWISTTGETTIVTLLFKPTGKKDPTYYVFGDVVSKLK